MLLYCPCVLLMTCASKMYVNEIHSQFADSLLSEEEAKLFTEATPCAVWGYGQSHRSRR